MPLNVLFIERLKKRRWSNLPHLVERTRAVLPRLGGLAQRPPGWIRTIVLNESLPLPEQVALFQDTSLLVAVGGAGAANAVFLPERSALVLVFAPGFESLRCLHVNTALAAGVHALVLRPPGVDGLGTGLHPRGPVQPALPVVASKAIGDTKWHKLDSRSKYR